MPKHKKTHHKKNKSTKNASISTVVANSECFEKTVELELPDKVLLNILKYLPSRRYAALVNKSFYEAVCEIEKGKFKINIDDSFEKDLTSICDSIMASKRQIDEICVSSFILFEPSIFNNLRKIFDKFSETLKVVTIHKCLIQDDQLFDLMGMFGSVESFNLTSNRVKMCNTAESFLFALTKLKKFDLSGTLLYSKRGSRPEEIDLFPMLMIMISKYSPLESFSAHSSLAQLFPFDKVKLQHLGLNQARPKEFRLADIVERQFKLKSLDLINCFIMDDVIKCIRTLEDLEVLKINASSITSSAFLSLNSLINLKELHVAARKAGWIIQALASNFFSTVTSLYVSLEDLEVPRGSMITMLGSLPRLKKLHIKTNSLDVIDGIFNVRNLRESLVSLTVEFCNLKLLKRTVKFQPKIDLNTPNIKELVIINTDINMASKGDFKFLKFFVNIKRITIKGFNIDPSLLQSAISFHYHLEYLELREVNESQVKYVVNDSLIQPMLEYGKNLKIVIIDCLAYHLSEVFTKFRFPINEHRGTTHYLKHR